MATDPGTAFAASKDSALERLRAAQGVVAYESHKGERVEGWPVSVLPSGEFRDGPYLTTEHNRVVLSVEGDLWEYTEAVKELQESPWTHTEKKYLNKPPMSIWVGTKGKPFSEIISTLDRTGW